MKNLTNDSKTGSMTSILRFQRFETLTKFELSKVKGGDGDDTPPLPEPN